MSKLNQIIAVEKGVKSRVQAELSKLYKTVQKPVLFEGLSKKWENTDEASAPKPPERKRVQVKAEEVLDAAAENLTELFDVTAQKDYANCTARADVVVGGTTLLKDVPATYLLFMEKSLRDVKALVTALPTLSTDEDWQEDKALGLFKTEAVVTQSTKKVQKPLVLHPATKEHPAQTQLITEDVVVGHWNTVRQSGASTETRKKQLIKRVDALTKAVKFAREAANSAEAPKQDIGQAVFGYLFGE